MRTSGGTGLRCSFQCGFRRGRARRAAVGGGCALGTIRGLIDWLQLAKRFSHER